MFCSLYSPVVAPSVTTQMVFIDCVVSAGDSVASYGTVTSLALGNHFSTLCQCSCLFCLNSNNTSSFYYWLFENGLLKLAGSVFYCGIFTQFFVLIHLLLLHSSVSVSCPLSCWSFPSSAQVTCVLPSLPFFPIPPTPKISIPCCHDPVHNLHTHASGHHYLSIPKPILLW